MIYRAIPSKRRSQVPAAFHCCNWKTGSQWVRLVLTDPRLYRQMGLLPEVFEGTLSQGPLPTRPLGDVHRPFIASPVYATQAQFVGLGPPRGSRAAFVTRDPRDLLVSYYFTNLESHPDNADVLARRRELAGLPLEQGLLMTFDHGFDRMIELGDSWLAPDNRAEFTARVFHFEGLTGADQKEHWTQLLEHLFACEVSTPLIARLLTFYSREHMRGRGETRNTKFKFASSGHWERYFTGAVHERFEQRYGNVVERWGYRR